MPHSFGLTAAAVKIAAIALLMTLGLAISAAHADFERLDGAGIATALNGKTIGGETWAQTFDATGITAYSENGEAPTQGRWLVRKDRFCSQWPAAPAWVCYDMFREGDLVVLVGENGKILTARITDGN